MTKILNKILSCLAVLACVLGCGFLLTGCDGNGAGKIMNLSINPSIELMLDANNKVVSVSANNDEGNFIVANATFVGLSAEEATNLFLEINYENGFIVKGSVADGVNQLEIQLSGSDAKSLYNKLKTSANEYLETIGANVQIELDEILDREDLEELVEECMQDLSDKEIGKMSVQELLDAIKTSRDETKDILSEELKELYYDLRAEEILKEKFIAIQTQLSQMLSIPGFDLSAIQTAFSDGITALRTAINQLKTNFAAQYLAEESGFVLAVQNYISAKKALLEARINETADLSSLESAFSSAKEAFENAKSSAENALDSFEIAIDNAVSALNTTLNLIANILDKDAIAQAIEDVKDKFKSSFENDFSYYMENSAWKDLAPSQAE